MMAQQKERTGGSGGSCVWMLGVERREDVLKREGGGGKQKNEKTRGKNDRKRCGDSSPNCKSHC